MNFYRSCYLASVFYSLLVLNSTQSLKHSSHKSTFQAITQIALCETVKFAISFLPVYSDLSLACYYDFPYYDC